MVDDGYLFSIFLYSEHKETDRQCKALVQSWHFHFKNRVIQRFVGTSVGAALYGSDRPLTDDVDEIEALAFRPGFIPWPAPPGTVADNNYYYYDDTTDYRRIKQKQYIQIVKFVMKIKSSLYFFLFWVSQISQITKRHNSH